VTPTEHATVPTGAAGRELPVIELIGDGRPPPGGVAALLGVVARRAQVRAHLPRAPRPDARLAVSPRALGLDRALADRAVPVAVVVTEPGDLRHPAVTAAAVRLLAGRAERAAEPALDGTTGPCVPLPPDALDPEAHPPVPPFVRAAVRRAYRLPDPLIVRVGYPSPTVPAERLLPSALAVASAAAVRGPHAALACALGTPLVTDPDTAHRLGAVDGVHLWVRAGGDVEPAVAALASDPERAASLGRGARALVLERLDLRRTATELLAGCGIAPPRPPHRPLAGLEAALDGLDTPPNAAVRFRALTAGRSLCDAVAIHELTGTRR